jgi:HPt (histidine-containing phosphotransfer) domain-containing protein
LQKIEALTARRSRDRRGASGGGTAGGGGGAEVQAVLAAPIDSASLLARCLGNTDLVSRLLKVFEPEIGGDLKRLEAAFDAGNGDDVANFAHAIKGSAANLSADALASLARELETAARQGEWQSRGELIERIRNEFRRCVEALPAVSATV